MRGTDDRRDLDEHLMPHVVKLRRSSVREAGAGLTAYGRVKAGFARVARQGATPFAEVGRVWRS